MEDRNRVYGLGNMNVDQGRGVDIPFSRVRLRIGEWIYKGQQLQKLAEWLCNRRQGNALSCPPST